MSASSGLVAPFLLQLLVNVSGKAADSLNIWALSLTWETPMELQAPGFRIRWQ